MGVFTCWFVGRGGQESSLLLRGAGKKWMFSQLEVYEACSGVGMGSGIWQEVGGEKCICG